MPFPEIHPTPRDSPLLFEAADLIQRYNHLATAFRGLEEQMPALLRERDELRRLGDELNAVYGKLTRKKFLVGFIGESGIGKSTAFNNLLDDVPKPELPAVPGPGGATTAAVMKLLAADQHTLLLRYMTPGEFNLIRDHMCEAVGIQAGLFPDRELLKSLPRVREEAKAGRGKQVALKSIEMLEKLLSARLKYPALVSDPAVVKALPYDNRDWHINHRTDDAAPDNLLLDVAEIGLHTSRIVRELEMIDLPGLGQGARDTYLTKKFLPQLDGTLVFYTAQNFTKDVGEVAFAALREVFQGRLEGRVWLVVTYFDSLTEEHLYGRRDTGVTAFDYLEKLLKDNGLLPAKVCFLSKKLFDSARGQGGENNRTAAGRDLGLHEGDRLPPRLAGMGPALSSAFEELLRDGGISNLRRLVTDRVAAEVRQQTREWCDRKLVDVDASLRAALRGELKLLSLGNDWIIQVTQWKTKMRVLLEDTFHRMPVFEKAAEDLRSKLEQSFLSVFPDNPALDNLKPADLKQEFPSHSNILEVQLDAHVTTTMIGSVYNHMRQEMNGLSEVEVLGCSSATRAWDRFRDEDVHSNAWRGQHRFPTFRSKELFRDLHDAYVGRLNGKSYRGMMLEKIRVTSRAAGNAIRMRVRERLRALNEALGKLAGDGAQPAPGGARELQDLLAKIEGNGS